MSVQLATLNNRQCIFKYTFYDDLSASGRETDFKSGPAVFPSMQEQPSSSSQAPGTACDVNARLVPGLSVVVLLWPVSLFGRSDLDRDFWNNNDSSTVQQRWSSYPPKEFVLNISPYAPYGDPRLTLKWVLIQVW